MDGLEEYLHIHPQETLACDGKSQGNVMGGCSLHQNTGAEDTCDQATSNVLAVNLFGAYASCPVWWRNHMHMYAVAEEPG